MLAASRGHAVVRTAWLYGVDGPNFVATMLRLAGERDAVQVVDDQIGSPTWSGHLAPAVLGLLEREVERPRPPDGRGAGLLERLRARRSSARPRSTCRVEPASSEQMARPAPRPAYSVLESERDDVLPMPPGRTASRDIWRRGRSDALMSTIAAPDRARREGAGMG